MRRIILVLSTVLLSAACMTTTTPEPTTTKEIGWRCGSLPETFQESDLIGTWQVIYEAAVSNDVITLREGGAYRQVYQKPNGFRYESPWSQWRIERRPSGRLYLHLEGMRYCALTDEVCENSEGGGGNRLFYDACEGRDLKMKGEVVLAVVGTEGSRLPTLENAPRGIALMHMKYALDTTSVFFILKE